MSTIFDLPIPQSGCGNTRFSVAGLVATLEFEFRGQGQDWIGAAQFDGVLAYRFRNEMHSRGFLNDAYEAVAALDRSEWLEELRRIAPDGINDVAAKKHFAVLLSSNGYFEVIAETCRLLPERLGTLAGTI